MTALIIALIVALSGGGVTLASQGSIPGDTLYGIKTLTENTRLVLAITPEAKAKLATKLAAERVAEIQKILAARGVEPKGLEIALSRLEKHMGEAAEAISKAKSRGKDVSALAKIVNDNIDSQTEKLGKILKEEKDALKNKIKELQNQIKEAESAGDIARAEDLVKQLEIARAEKEELKIKEEKTGEIVSRENEKIEKELEAREAAVEAIAEAKKAHEEILQEIVEKKIEISEDVFNQYNNFIVKAEEAFKNEHYIQARQYARQSKDALKHVEKAIENEEDQENAARGNGGDERNEDEKIKDASKNNEREKKEIFFRQETDDNTDNDDNKQQN